MNRFFWLIGFWLLTVNCFCQYNQNLSGTLDSMAAIGQQERNDLVNYGMSSKLDSIQRVLWKKVETVDSMNYLLVKNIFNLYGFPGYKLVGKTSSGNFWLLVQHSDRHLDFQQRVLSSMKQHVDSNDASGKDYAYLVDRCLINSGKMQIYGTQLKGIAPSLKLAPTQDTANLDKRRAEVGLFPIKAYLYIVDSIYSVHKDGK